MHLKNVPTASIAMLVLLMCGDAFAQSPAAPPARPAAVAPLPPRLPAKKKLVMKDGSDQAVREWERQGDRVRYFSIERQEWEEVPAALVDWKATEEANRANASEGTELAERAAEADRKAQDEIIGPEVAPGVRMPESSDGLFVVVNQKLVPLPKQTAAARLDKGRLATNVLLPIPVLKNRSLVEIPGARSELRLDSSPAALFAAGKAQPDSRYALVRLKVKEKVRQVEAIEVNMLGRNPTHSGNYIELTSQEVAPDVFKLVPSQPLSPGEYAVVEFLGKNINIYMWDFGVGQ